MEKLPNDFHSMNLPPALRHREFRLFASGYLFAETGEYIHFIVQNWLVWELTHSAFYLGLVGFCEFAPRFIFGPIGGVIADRMDRLKLLIAARILNLLQTLVFAFLIFAGMIQLWHIVVLVIFMAIVSSVSTAAQQVLVVSLVPQDSVMSALALHSTTHNLTKVIGPSIGGVLFAMIGSGNCLLIQAVTILLMLATLFFIKPPASPFRRGDGNFLQEIGEGFSYLRQNHRVLITILTTYSNGFFGISYTQFLPYFAQEVMHVGATGYGFMVSAPGVGAVAVSFLLSSRTKLQGMRRLLLGASIIYAASIFLFAISPSIFLSIPILAVIGAMQMSYRVLARAIIQEETPNYLLGRAMSLFFMDRGFGSLGALALGVAAAVFPVPLAVAGSAVLSGLAAWGVSRIPGRGR